MSYRLELDESIPDGIRRIVYEQIDKAIASLTQSTKADLPKAVHNVRKRFKKIRAVIRLVRDELGKDLYHQENACYRDAGRQLSAVRDAQVRIETLDSLVDHFGETVDETGFTELREALEARYDATRKHMVQEEEAIATVIATLKSARERVADWPLQNHWSALAPGLKRVYERGYEALATAETKPTSEHWHDWRKRVKYLWYHVRILKNVWPSMMSELADQLKDLADDLGDDHDLAVLRQFILEQPQRLEDHSSEHHQLSAVIALGDRRQMELQQSAQQLGHRLYAEKPKAFMKRMKAYWKISHAEATAPELVTA